MVNGASAAKIFLKDEYDELMAFFRKTWEEPSATESYEYRVYLAQKGFNLHELFFLAAFDMADEKEKTRLTEIRKRTFLSQTGFILQAPRLAECYERRKAFPRIMICDELLKTGHDFMEIVMGASRAIVEELYGSEPNQSYQLRIVYSKLIDAIDFFVFMRSTDDSHLTYLPPHFFACYRPKNTPASKWYAFVQNSSASIVFSDKVENTVFLPTFRINQSLYDSISERLRNGNIGWRRESWRFWNKSAVVWQRSSYNVNNELYMQQAVRCSFHADTKQYAITPYLFWRASSDAVNDRLFARFAAVMRDCVMLETSGQTEENPFAPFIDILCNKSQYASGIKSQLVLAICSVLLFFGFVEDGAALDAITDIAIVDNSDLAKTSASFGQIGTIFPTFCALVSESAYRLRLKLWENLRNHLLVYGEPLCSYNEEDRKHGRDAYLTVATEHLLAVDTEQQKVIQYRKIHQINFGPDSQYFESDGFMYDYLNSNCFPENYSSLDKKVGALLILLLWGTTGVAIHRRKVEKSSDEESDLYLNVGESTEIIRAMKMLRFIPALSYVKKVCDQELYSPRSMVKGFGEYLDKKFNSKEYAAEFCRFYDWCKETGRTLSDWEGLSPIWLDQPDLAREIRTRQEWNGKPWEQEIYADSGKTTMTDYLVREENQRAFYLNQARRFMGVHD